MSKQDDAPDYEGFFSELEARLANLSHTDEAVRVIESTVSARFKKTAHRQVAFAFPGGICVDPIVYEDAVVAGKIAFDEDHFSVLQAARGCRFHRNGLLHECASSVGPLFAVLNSTCDLVPGRRQYASLLRISPIVGTGDAVKSTLHHLLSFQSRRDLNLPPLRQEDPPSLGYSICFDGVAQIRVEDLLVARRGLLPFA